MQFYFHLHTKEYNSYTNFHQCLFLLYKWPTLNYALLVATQWSDYLTEAQSRTRGHQTSHGSGHPTATHNCMHLRSSLAQAATGTT